MRYSFLAFLLGAISLQTGCGGGGSSSAVHVPPNQTGSAPVVPTTPPAVVTPPSVSDDAAAQMSVTSTYPASATVQKAAFDLLNAERLACGFGVLNRSEQLDAATLGHARYLVKNQSLLPEEQQFSHQQFGTNLPFFTATNPFERADKAGYGRQVSDQLFGIEFKGTVGVLSRERVAEAAVRSLLSAPYHLNGMVSGMRDVGIALVSNQDADMGGGADTGFIFNLMLGLKSGLTQQAIARDALQTYPCAGTTDTVTHLFNEDPNPIEGRDLREEPIGQPILIRTAVGQTLEVTASQLLELPIQRDLTLLELNASNDPNRKNFRVALINPNEVILMPDQPLKPNTQYRVRVEARVDGQVVPAVDFVFSTGDQNKF